MATNTLSFDLDTYKKYLRNSSLFRGIPEDKYQNVLNCLQARVEYYPAGTPLVNAGDKDFRAGVLLEGGLEEFIYDENANPVVISHLKSGSVFGAELACGNSLASQFYLDASVDSRVLLLDFQILSFSLFEKSNSNFLHLFFNSIFELNKFSCSFSNFSALSIIVVCFDNSL